MAGSLRRIRSVQRFPDGRELVTFRSSKSSAAWRHRQLIGPGPTAARSAAVVLPHTISCDALFDEAVFDFARIPMDGLMRRLGFVVPKSGNRTNCVLCGSTGGTCFSYRPDGRWHCFRCDAGGGKLRLVELALVLERRAAMEWLSKEFAVPLRPELTREERSAWFERRRRAEAEGRELFAWKNALIANLRARRNELMEIYHASKNYLLHHDLEECERKQDFRFEIAVHVAFTYWPRVEQLDAQIDRLVSAPYSALLRHFRADRDNA